MAKFLGPNLDINTNPGGDEGGEIRLPTAETNTTLNGPIKIDVYQNKLRFFEGGSPNRGAYIDLSSASNGVGSNLLASGGGATTLDGLTDVVITSPEEFQGLSYNGTSWVNSHIPVVSYVRNAESTTLTTGTAVYLFGSTGDHATVKRADNDSDTTSSKVIGLVGANISASQNGPVVTRGYVDGINLSTGYTAGDILWLGEDGGFTKTKPSAPEHLVFLGVVVRATNNGIIYVAAQNGYELEELHDVDINTGTLASGDFLKYNGTLWVNDPINLGTDTTGDYVASLVAGSGITITNNSGEGATPTVTLSDVVANPQTATYTLALTDKNKMVEMNVGSANIVYVPTNGSVAFPVGSTIDILQTGTGKTQIVATSSGTTTINSANGFYLRAQWSAATLVKRATDTWVLFGDTSTS